MGGRVARRVDDRSLLRGRAVTDSACGCLLGQSCSRCRSADGMRRFEQLYLSFSPPWTGRADLARAATVREFLEMPGRDLPWLACCLLGRRELDAIMLQLILEDLARRGVEVE